MSGGLINARLLKCVTSVCKNSATNVITMLLFQDEDTRGIKIPATGKLNIYMAVDVSASMKEFSYHPKEVVKTLLRKVKTSRLEANSLSGQLKVFNSCRLHRSPPSPSRQIMKLSILPVT